jgi:hypothetical protein
MNTSESLVLIFSLAMVALIYAIYAIFIGGDGYVLSFVVALVLSTVFKRKDILNRASNFFFNNSQCTPFYDVPEDKYKLPSNKAITYIGDIIALQFDKAVPANKLRKLLAESPEADIDDIGFATKRLSGGIA